WPGAERYQESFRVLNGFAAWVYVPGGWRRRVFRRGVAPDDARVLQGAAVPRRRQRDPRVPWRAGYAAHGRLEEVRSVDLPDSGGCFAGDFRLPFHGRLLQ